MGIIDINELEKRFNDEILFSSLSLSLNKNDKLAIIGNNGVGKTTLLKIILGIETHDKGDVTISPHATIGYLSQVMIKSMDNTLYEEMLSVFSEVREIEQKMQELTVQISNNPEDKEMLKKYEKLENRFVALDGYNYLYKIDVMIGKFGFSKEDYNRKISTFSGGERNKIAFTRLLLDHPDVLILDEPTNHLDMNTVEWLEEYLKNYDGSIILVTHDRYFVDAVCNCVFEIANKTGDYYRGNYSYYLQEKVIRYEQQLRAYDLQEKEIKHLEALIKRFKPKPTKVGLAKDREKKLAKILDNKIEKPIYGSKQINLDIQAKDDRRVKQITFKELKFGYNIPLCAQVNGFTVWGGDKLGIIGENGIGKTTLLKTINKQISPLEGEIYEHRKLSYGYVDQNTIQIDSDETVFDYIHNKYPYMNNYEVRSQLGNFLFSDEAVFKKINMLSGGEKVRLCFALLLLQKYDILLLDEPTNHMDIETRKVLESSLIEYPGTIIFVSHDRYFIDELATKLLILKRNSVNLFEGDYSKYLESLNQKDNNKQTVIIEDSIPKEKKINKKPERKLSKEKLEVKIKELEQEIEDKKELMFEEEYYTNQIKMNELDDEIVDLHNKLKHLEDEYLELLEEESK